VSERIAIIVDVANFDDHALNPLPGALVDGDRIEVFARDPGRGACTQIIRLKDPTLQELKTRLADALVAAGTDPDNTALIYFATHGTTEGPHGLYLAVRDTRIDRLSTSWFALSELIALLDEHRPTRTITVIDACESGGHVGGTAALSRDKLWRDLNRSVDVREGHFFAVACATREGAEEDKDGGIFTSALLNAVEATGQEHPSVEWLSVEQVMNDLIREQLPAAQTPEWTGIAVSLSVLLARNAHYDPTVPAVHGSVQIPQLDPNERVMANRAIRLHWNAMQLVGTGNSWLDTACRAISSVASSLPAKAEPMVRQMFASLDQVIATHGDPDDRLAHTHYARQAIVMLGHLAAGTPFIEDVVQRVADRAKLEVDELQMFIDDRAWIVADDKAANFGLSTIRFWRRLGAASFVAMCARLSAPADASVLAQKVRDAVAAKPALRRVVWMGQYCDLASTLGLVACVDEPLVREVSKTMFDRLVQKVDKPVSPNLRGRDLGRAIAWAMLEVESEDDWVDEGIPLFLAQLRMCNAPAPELDGLVTTLAAIRNTDWAFYEEEEPIDSTVRTMSTREPSTIFPRRNDLEALLARADGLRTRALGATPDEDRTNMLVGLAGAATFQNRAGVWPVSHMAAHWVSPNAI